MLTSDLTTTTTRGVSFTELPVPISAGRSSSFLCVSGDGNLSVASVSATRMEVWTQQDGDEWLRAKVIEIPPMPPRMNYYPFESRRDWFAFHRGSVLALYGGDRIFVLDIERGVLERVMDCPTCLLINGHGTCVPPKAETAVGTTAIMARRNDSVPEHLPEDVLFEIFSRVKDLRCALTCKPWLHLLADRSFLRRLWPDRSQGRRGLLGFFFEKESFLGVGKWAISTGHTRMREDYASTFVPTPESLLGPGYRPLTSFVADHDGAFDYAEVVASRNGILLMRLNPGSSPGIIDVKKNAVGLCNPITGERHVAPPLIDCACLGWSVNGYAILTDADAGDFNSSPSSGTFLKLLLIGYDHHQDGRHLHVHTYPATTRSWSACTRYNQSKNFGIVGSYKAAVVHHGSAHWLYIHLDSNDNSLYMLAVEVNMARASFIQLPISRYSISFLCVSGDDKLSVASVYPTHMDVWTQQRDGGDAASWLRTQVIHVPPRVLPRHVRTWSYLNMGSLLALYQGGSISVIDMETKVWERVMDCPPCLLDNAKKNCVPFEVDLSEFFVLRLGALSRGLS
ncbi:hypothetical protein PR202_gb03869 [Eleusine coracana subsp. coracana]|uniref:F-box domain-containing protein n=1 Tax=Eleusine coracana subsp. coracana TaxID=191504 RepID=A0AAV5E326_ELECO|nr:hypothetical protein PR202_gb03869 [Eleusine coracana subsp. coracana]